MALILPASFKDFNLKPYVEPDYHRLIVYSYGLDATGKTDFALSAPGPIVIFNNDKELGDMPSRRFKGKVIAQHEYFTPPDLNMNKTAEVQEAHKALIIKFKQMFRRFVKDPDIKTIVMDNGTTHWRMVQLACFGTLKPGKSNLAYDTANAEMDMIFNAIRQSRKNFIITHQAGKLYKKGKSEKGKSLSEWDGASYECKGWSHVAYAPTVGLVHEKSKAGLSATIIKCAVNKDLEGFPLTDEELDFAALGQMIYPDSKAEEWA